jgi:hypothetical protein
MVILAGFIFFLWSMVNAASSLETEWFFRYCIMAGISLGAVVAGSIPSEPLISIKWNRK